MLPPVCWRYPLIQGNAVEILPYIPGTLSAHPCPKDTTAAGEILKFFSLKYCGKGNLPKTAYLLGAFSTNKGPPESPCYRNLLLTNQRIKKV